MLREMQQLLSRIDLGKKRQRQPVRQATDTEREERAVLCEAKAISLFPSWERPGNDALL